MAGKPLSKALMRESLKIYAQFGSERKSAEHLGIPRSTFQNRLKMAQEKEKELENEQPRIPLNPPIKVKKTKRRYLLTAAQDETPLHEGFWKNLNAFSKHINAEILIGGFTYQKGLFEDHSVRSGSFSPRIIPHLSPEPVDLAPLLTWYAKANIVPTAVNPLTGWDTQTREKWCIIPHAKIALTTIPTMPGRMAKQVMSTGVVTQANYVQRNLGQKAEFHHTIGCVIVEVASDGAFWCRQISATEDGSFQDLDKIVSNGKVTTGNSIEAFNPGDLHSDEIDERCARLALGMAPGDKDFTKGNMIDTLKPKVWFAHDSYSFNPRSHHTRNDPHERARRVIEGNDSVQSEIALVSRYLHELYRPFTEIIHIASNHNMHLDGWLKDFTAYRDPHNCRYWHELNAAYYRAIEQGENSRWLIHEYALRNEFDLSHVKFLSEGESYLICENVAPIECALHSHIGPRGARGSIVNLSKIVERVNIGHSHKPGIREAAYQSGTLSRRDLTYASRGPGDWFPSHIFTYPNAKRTIITQWEDGRWKLD